jgi:hypothetical protein
MNCIANCSVGIVLLIANIFCMFSVDKYTIKKKLYDSLSFKLKERYVKIVKERRDIYYRGFVLGILLSFMMVALMLNTNKNIPKRVILCTTLGITFLTNYFYYILSPKSDWMILHLNERRQREAWLDIYRTMSIRFHTGFLLGLLGVTFLTNGSCIYLKKGTKTITANKR